MVVQKGVSNRTTYYCGPRPSGQLRHQKRGNKFIKRINNFSFCFSKLHLYSRPPNISQLRACAADYWAWLIAGLLDAWMAVMVVNTLFFSRTLAIKIIICAKKAPARIKWKYKIDEDSTPPASSPNPIQPNPTTIIPHRLEPTRLKDKAPSSSTPPLPSSSWLRLLSNMIVHIHDSLSVPNLDCRRQCAQAWLP